MRKDNLVSAVMANHRKLSDETNNIDEFFAERFVISLPNAASCVVSGSSIVYPHIDYQEAHLDAAATRFITDENGIIVELRIATTDGLGDSRTDPEQNAITRLSAKLVSESFCTQQYPSQNTPQQNLMQVCAQVNQLCQSSNQNGDTALAATSVKISQDSIDVTFANVGDTAIIVLDAHDLRAKFVMAPRVVNRGGCNWSPLSLQQLRRSIAKNLPTAGAQFNQENSGINPGDYIVQMTDGAWPELAHTTIQGEKAREKWLEYPIDVAFLNNTVWNTVQPMSLQIANALTRAILNRNLAKRSELNSLLQSIRPYLDIQDKQLGVIDWLKLLDEATASKLKYYIFENDHDGICFTEKAEAYIVAKALQEYCIGDCTTLSVTQVPDWRIELIRALIEHLENAPKLLPKIAAKIDADTVNTMLNQLQHESFIASHNGITRNLSQFKLTNVYNAQQISAARSLIEAYLKISKLLMQSNFSAIKELCQSLPKSVMTHLDRALRELLRGKLHFNFNNRFLNYQRYQNCKEVIRVLNTASRSENPSPNNLGILLPD